MEKGTVNIRVIVDRIKRHPLLKDVSLEQVINYLIDFIQIVGCPGLFCEKKVIVPIDSYRGELPCDFVEVISVRGKIKTNKSHYIAYRYSEDVLYPIEQCGRHDKFVYKINGRYIFISRETGEIEVVYRAIETDKEGYPVLPDDPVFFRAFEAYVKQAQFTFLFDMGKLQPAIQQQARQDYAWAVGALETEYQRLSLDKAESLMNSWFSLLRKKGEHRTSFIHDGE